MKTRNNPTIKKIEKYIRIMTIFAVLLTLIQLAIPVQSAHAAAPTPPPLPPYNVLMSNNQSQTFTEGGFYTIGGRAYRVTTYYDFFYGYTAMVQVYERKGIRGAVPVLIETDYATWVDNNTRTIKAWNITVICLQNARGCAVYYYAGTSVGQNTWIK